MSKVNAIFSVVREPCRISLLAGTGDGVSVAVGRGVGRGVGWGVGRAVEFGVGSGVGRAVGSLLDTGAEAHEVDAGVGMGELGDGAGDPGIGAARPQLATPSATTRVSHASWRFPDER